MKPGLDDAHWMQQAMALAQQAANVQEVPVGAVVVHRNEVIAQAHNQTLSLCDPTAHAEILALRLAAQQLGNRHLSECTLYVTTEPCLMCAGAVAQARVHRLVYGCHEPRTGAIASVIQGLALPGIHPQIKITSGVLAQESQGLMQRFFQRRRQESSDQRPTPLPDTALRTPEEAFSQLPDYPWTPHYFSNAHALDGLRLHYLDEGPRLARRTWLLLHGNPTWSYLWRHIIPVLLDAGDRVVAPDLPGFGRSDKPKKTDWHTFERHRLILIDLIQHLNLQHIFLAVQDWGGILGLTLPMAEPKRFEGLWLMNTWLATGLEPLTPGFLAWRDMCRNKPDFDIARLMLRARPDLPPEQAQAYNAPFPNAGFRAATRAFPHMLPDQPGDSACQISQAAQDFYQQQWQGRSLMTIGGADPVLGELPMRMLAASIRGLQHIDVHPSIGHFVPDCGPVLASTLTRQALQHFQTC